MCIYVQQLGTEGDVITFCHCESFKSSLNLMSVEIYENKQNRRISIKFFGGVRPQCSPAPLKKAGKKVGRGRDFLLTNQTQISGYSGF
jgi:hypothetical protein